jgi:predicted DNA-binding protein
MISKHIRFTKEQDKALEKLSVLTGAPVTELVRRAVEEYLRKQKSA